MCKYCELKEQEYEAYNNADPINEVTDGSQVFVLYLNRYIDKRKKHRRTELVMDLDVKVSKNEVYTVKEKHIKIKYCPFCGEEL